MPVYERRNQGDTSNYNRSSVALDLTFLRMSRGNAGRNVKSATLVSSVRGRHRLAGIGRVVIKVGGRRRLDSARQTHGLAQLRPPHLVIA